MSESRASFGSYFREVRGINSRSPRVFSSVRSPSLALDGSEPSGLTMRERETHAVVDLWSRDRVTFGGRSRREEFRLWRDFQE